MRFMAGSVATSGLTREGGDELEKAVLAAINAAAGHQKMGPAELARATGISQPMVSLLLDGHRTLTIKYLERFSSALKMKPTDFFPDDGRQPATLAALEQHIGRTYIQTINMIWDLQRQGGAEPQLAAQPTKPPVKAQAARMARQARRAAARAKEEHEAAGNTSDGTGEAQPGEEPPPPPESEDRPTGSPHK